MQFLFCFPYSIHRKFETNVLKIAKSFVNEKIIVDFHSDLDQLFQIGMSDLPISQIVHADATTKREIGELQRGLSALEIFDQFKAMVVQSKEQLVAMCIETDRNVLDLSECVKELQANSSKLGDIKHFPKLMDMEKANTLAKLSLQSVRNFKIFNKMPIY